MKRADALRRETMERAAATWAVPTAALAVVLAGVLATGTIRPLAAQELEAIPTFAPGGNAVLLPVQSVRPLPSGAYPGGARSQRAAREAITAEFSFAFSEAEEGAGTWKLPADVIRVMGRNPTLHVDPEHLAYQGLIAKPKDLKRYQVYEPLHGQLRAISAMFDTRHLVLPLQVSYEPFVPEAGDEDGEESASPPPEPVNVETADPGAPIGRAVLVLALIDIRRSQVLWHGEVRGDPAPIDSSALFASLAARLADWLVLF